MPPLTISEIESRADKLILKYSTPPIPVHRVALGLGILVEPAVFGDDVSGVLFVQNETGVIGFNREHSSVRQRFTIAHEIGHFVLHRQESQLFIDKGYRAFFRDVQSAKGKDRREVKANAFAAALLMPSRLVQKAVKSHAFDLGDDRGALIELATLFEVSTQAMSFRLANLGLLELVSE